MERETVVPPNTFFRVLPKTSSRRGKRPKKTIEDTANKKKTAHAPKKGKYLKPRSRTEITTFFTTIPLLQIIYKDTTIVSLFNPPAMQGEFTGIAGRLFHCYLLYCNNVVLMSLRSPAQAGLKQSLFMRSLRRPTYVGTPRDDNIMCSNCSR